MRVIDPVLQRVARVVALSAALAFAPVLTPPIIAADRADAGLLAPLTPQWVVTENGVALQRLTDENSKMPSKDAKRVYDAGVEYANRGADEETQVQNDVTLKRAEDRFTLLIDELAPNYYGGYTNRANVRVARGNYAGAVADYEAALKLAPLAKDTWVTYLNLGRTLIALDQAPAAMPYLQRSVELSNANGGSGDPRLALLGRASAYHQLEQWSLAADDYGAALAKRPSDVQPFWLRFYSLDLYETPARRAEALGIVRRVAAKFDIEPETQLAACSLPWAGGSEIEKDEALRRWSLAPVETRRSMVAMDLKEKSWPPAARLAAMQFRAVAPVPPPVPPPAAVEAVESPAAEAPADPLSSPPLAAPQPRPPEVRKLTPAEALAKQLKLDSAPTAAPDADGAAPPAAPLGTALDERVQRLEELKQLREQLAALQAAKAS